MIQRVIIYSITYIVVGVLMGAICHNNDMPTLDIITYEGLWTSVYGIILTLIQVYQVKKTTEETEKAVKATRKQMDLVLSVSDISKHIVNLRSVKEYVTNGKLEMARLRLGDVKDFMGKIGYIDDLGYEKTKHKRLINILESNITSLEQDIYQIQSVDKTTFCKDMEAVVTFLSEVEYKLKSK